MSELEAVVYVSTAKTLLNDQELVALLTSARKSNDELGVTGVLLYHDGSFLQYFEGPHASVDQVYNKVRHSSMHHGLLELMREPIATRRFGSWSMGFTQVPKDAILQLSNTLWLHGQAQAEAASGADSMGVALLKEFWESNRPFG